MPSSNTIPKTQAYTLIGGTLLLICCVCTLLAAWRFWPTRPSAAVVAAYPIVYDGDGWLERGIYAIKPEGGEPVLLAHKLPIGAYEQPAWSPDGSQIAFSTDRGEGDEIFLLNSDGSNLRQLTRREGYSSGQPAWSPDGRKIAFSGEAEVEGKYYDQIFVINVDGSNQVRLTRNRGYDGNPDWKR